MNPRDEETIETKARNAWAKVPGLLKPILPDLLVIPEGFPRRLWTTPSERCMRCCLEPTGKDVSDPSCSKRTR
jgi:hypothetical protein